MEALSNGAFRVELPNGHRVWGFGSRRLRTALAVGDPVVLDLSPADFSRGRIVRIGKHMSP